MKKVLNFVILVSFLAGVAALHSCKKDPTVPVMTTTAASSVTTISASSGGNITDDGGAEVTARGVCWGTSQNPTVSGSKTSDGKGIGSFTSAIAGLTPNTLYYVRAYATNSAGTGYGNEVSFTTNAVIGATVTTTIVTSITSTTAVSGGNITSDGGGSITARGVCWATTANPDLTKSKTTDGTGTGTFTSNITGLTPGTIYHVRAYATNTFGTTYGADVQFTSSAVLATVTTTAPTNITQTTATTGGNVTANGGAPVTARGVCYGTAQNPTIAGPRTTDGTGDGAFTSNLTGLTPGTTYYVRAYATNSVGTAYGAEFPLPTAAVLLPTVTTVTPNPSTITATTAVSGGNVTADGGGAVTARGVCWSTSPSPVATGSHTTDGTGTGAFTSNITGLTGATVYYIRAYATNSAGTAYGNEVSIRTFLGDADGNLYNTVVIGTQVWMAENLKTTKFNNGNSIPNVTDNAAWIALATPAYAWYNNDEATNKPLYGALYNWYAVGAGNLCPTGWHVASHDDYKTLEIFQGMSQVQADAWGWRGTDEGSELKNTTGWSAGQNGTNTSGFSALPNGFRYVVDGSFFNAGTLGYWWTSTEVNADDALYRRMDGNSTQIYAQGVKKVAGKAVRCVKD